MVHAFWQFLNALQHNPNEAVAETANGYVVYGGHALQAFVTALQEGLRFIWIDKAS